MLPMYLNVQAQYAIWSLMPTGVPEGGAQARLKSLVWCHPELSTGLLEIWPWKAMLTTAGL